MLPNNVNGNSEKFCVRSHWDVRGVAQLPYRKTRRVKVTEGFKIFLLLIPVYC